MSENIASIDLSNETEIPSTKGMTTKVVKGSIWTLAGQILPLFASLVSTPFIIRFLGSEGYGILILVGLIPSYFAFADFGMGIASTKFGSEAYGQGQRKKEGEIVRTAAFIALLTSLVFAVPIFLFSYPIIVYLNVSEHFQSSASVALKITSVTFVLGFLSSIFNTPQLSRLRMDLNTLVNAVPKVLMLLLTPVVLFLGGGIVEAVFLAFSAAFLMLCGHIFFSGRLLKELFQATISRKLIRPLMKLGGGLLMSGIAITLLNNLEKIFLTRLVSVESLAYYSIAFTLASMAAMFSSAMIQSLIPAFSQLLTPEKKGEFDALFSRSMRINLILLLPSIMFLFVIAKPFFTIWAGPKFGTESAYPFYILLFGLFFNILAYVPYSAITAFGRTDVFAKLFWIELFPYIGLVTLLISSFQIVGAAMAWSFRLVIDAFFQIWLAKKIVGTSFNFFDYLGSLILVVLILSPPIIFAGIYDNFSPWLIFLVPVCTAVYSITVWRKFVTTEEKFWITNKLKGLLNLIGNKPANKL